MRKPRLSDNTLMKLEIYGYAVAGKNAYELKDYIDTEGKCYTMLEWTNIKTGDTEQFDWKEYTKEA